MIGLDTNVIVRYLVQDDPAQSRAATDIIENRLNENEPGFVTVVVIAELVWVLDRAYGFPDSDIAAAIERMLQTDVLVIEHEEDVFIAMTALKNGDGSFADALIGARNARAGSSRTLTFDRKAARLPGFELA